MGKNPHAPPANEKEQFQEVARLLGVAFHRLHRLNQSQIRKSVASVEPGLAVQPHCNSADHVVNSAEIMDHVKDSRPL
jgi:hypothetical protein